MEIIFSNANFLMNLILNLKTSQKNYISLKSIKFNINLMFKKETKYDI